ncbi:uncharacterized protein SPSK_09951 [Sporothrix schenckii 1099-18]|uniref:Uncharacterized protein n=2 Tax=Sporothrix schenckii TaxID=29908 RepID=U7PW52_SPOS1|nr:uncharacterized protein SPSK_09951 [Sporothrix schenckii 1099-18]ERS99832.1 hypothetical protein HMPREF1624_03197 [Sporothrix schenckii ATCC 58251]KJR85783.1 hypothetical protein SPSK_09951 [Sporothrix schenckii 1099-18]
MAEVSTAEVSHGRGGAGNIVKDDTKYVDGEIVRAGIVGSHDDGPYSTGRGGAANIGDSDKRRSLERADRTLVPDAAVRPSADLSDYHTGRGGAANVHLGPESEKKKAEKAAHEGGGPPPMVGLADKLKHKLTGVFKK